MTRPTDPAASQLADQLRWWHDRLSLYGFIDSLQPARDIDTWAAVTVAELRDGDDRTRVGAAQAVLEFSGVDMEPDDGWWTSPLGVLVAAVSPDVEDEWISQKQATDALGVSRRTFARLLDDGTIATKDGAGRTGGRAVSRRDVSALVVARASG